MELENGGSLRVEKNFIDVKLPEDLPEDRMDNRILKICSGVFKDRGEAGRPGDQRHSSPD